jgi:hypothetical protein
MLYMLSKLANRSFGPIVVETHTLNLGFRHDFAASDNYPLGGILCNLATVSIFQAFF